MKKNIWLLAGLLIIPAFCIAHKKKQPEKKTLTPAQTLNNSVVTKRTIHISNGITPSMLEYRYCGKHSPESFSVSINNKKVETGKSITTELCNDILEVEYNYSFAKGLYKGRKVVTLNVEPKAEKVNLAFSWKDPLHIQADHAQAQSIRAAKKP